MSVPDFLHLGSIPLSRSFAHLGLAMSISSETRSDLFSFVVDSVHLASPASIQTFGHADFLLLALDFTGLGLLFPFHSFAQCDSALLPFGLSRTDPSFLILDPVKSDFPLSIRSFAQRDSVLPALGISRLDLSMLLSDSAILELTPLVQSSVHLGLVLPTLDMIHADLNLFSRSYT